MPLICGPWIGEFGWQLMSWQGFVRKTAANNERVIVVSGREHKALYADIKCEFEPIDINGDRDCWKAHGKNREIRELVSALQVKYPGYRMVSPTRGYGLHEQTFVQYGNLVPSKVYDIVVHARANFGRGAGRVWELEKWNAAVEKWLKAGLTVAAIGTQAMCPKGAIDLRNLPLSDVMDVFRSSRVACGPSSGPMHLASLCGTFHCVWTDNIRRKTIRGTNRDRYERIWNPLKTPCLVLDSAGWNPSVDAVVDLVNEGLSKCIRQ